MASLPEPCGPGKVLVLLSGSFAGIELYLAEIQARGLDAARCLRPIRSTLLRALRRTHLALPLPFKAFWFADWEHLISGKSLVIVEAADLHIPVARHLVRRLPEADVVFWYWNPTSKGTNPARAKGKGFTLWSFDAADCARFGMSNNTQYSFANLAEIAGDLEPEVDFFFYGVDKGRASALSELANHLERFGLTYSFNVVTTAGRDLQQFPRLTAAGLISYVELLRLTARSRVVVDIAQAGQSGLTLRALEALYLGKKLVTTSSEVRESALYEPSRVFLLGDQPITELPAFLRTAMTPASPRVLAHYDFSCWVERFRQPPQSG